MNKNSQSKRFLVIALVLIVTVAVGFFVLRMPRKKNVRVRQNDDAFLMNRLPGSFQFFTDAKHESFSTVDVAISDDGLVISGNMVINPKYPLPQNSDHYTVQIKLATELPETLPIGWGHQFGDVVLTAAEDCYKEEFDFSDEERNQCRTWYFDQLKERDKITRMFQRQWKVTLQAAISEPRGLEQISFGLSDWPELKHYSITIPWNEMPPINNGMLDKIMLSIILPIESRNKVESDTTIFLDGLVSVAGSEYRELFLSKTHSFKVTGCDLIPVAYDFFLNRSSTSYVVPRDASQAKDVFMIDIPRHGYQYMPEGTSPIITKTEYFDKNLGDDLLVCGPDLTVLNKKTGDRILSDVFLARPSYKGDELKARRISDDVYLLQAGPYEFSSFYGSGQCGACPRYGIEMYKLDLKNLTISQLFSDEDMSDGDSHIVDYAVSADMKKIMVSQSDADYRDETRLTTTAVTTYCLNAEFSSFDPCGKTEETTEE